MKNFFKNIYADFGFKIISKFSMIPKTKTKLKRKKIPPALHNFSGSCKGKQTFFKVAVGLRKMLQNA